MIIVTIQLIAYFLPTEIEKDLNNKIKLITSGNKYQSKNSILRLIAYQNLYNIVLLITKHKYTKLQWLGCILAPDVGVIKKFKPISD
jgi:hypothetical protein